MSSSILDKYGNTYGVVSALFNDELRRRRSHVRSGVEKWSDADLVEMYEEATKNAGVIFSHIEKTGGVRPNRHKSRPGNYPRRKKVTGPRPVVEKGS